MSSPTRSTATPISIRPERVRLYRYLGGLIPVLAALAAAASTAACNQGPELTCKVNDQCFVCPTEKARAMCVRDPSVARCKWAEPSHCRGK